MFKADRRSIYLGYLLTGAILLGASVVSFPVRAQQCEVPLFVQQSLVGANVMILADNSLSMNTAVMHKSYDPNVVYTGDFSSTSDYNVKTSGFRAPSDFKSGWPATPLAYLVASDAGQNGLYPGNYLNWVYYHANPIQVGEIPQVTRIQVLKEVLKEIVTRSSKLDFGITVFNGDKGGDVLAPCGTDDATIIATIDGIKANGYTPLGESMETILDYFSVTGAGGAITQPCQYNFTLVVTDGLPTRDINVSPYLFDADGDGNDPGSCATLGAPYDNSLDCSDYFDDVAYYMAHNDLRGDLEGDQFVYTYVIGYQLNNQLLVDAAANGEGLFFEASNAVEMFMSFEFAVQDILRRISAGSAVAVVSTERGTDNRLYRGKFMPMDWTGFLECYSLPYQQGNPAIWEAGAILQGRSPVSREIFTAIGSNYVYFSAANAVQLRPYLGVAFEQQAADLIDWARGEDVPGLRDRQGWVLGDIIHSTPVVVGKPSGFTPEPSYSTFHTAYEGRRKMVYVGANDGMLHAFDADLGDEVWAFVPQFALPTFSVMADSGYCHTYNCDQTVTVKDIQVGGAWKTVLMSGGREGGGSIYALDITDPNTPQVMWQAVLPNGLVFESEVEIVSIGGQATALVGSGLDEATNRSFIYSYDIATGNLNGELELNAGQIGRNKATKPVPVDRTLDGETDLVYIADLNSTVWRFETGGDPNPVYWSRSEFFKETGQEITADPVVANGQNGEVMLYFGTGAYLVESDMLDTAQQSFVCVIDRHDKSTITRMDLVDQTNSINATTGSRGWYVDLWNNPGERVTQKAAVVAETVIFTTFAPSADACQAGGQSWLYQMAYDSGGLTNSKEMTDVGDRSLALGEGMASYPVIDLATGNIVVQSSDASITVTPISATFQRMTVKAWREDYDQVDQSFVP
jgi:type IV pilus assembly protein PilY1